MRKELFFRPERKRMYDALVLTAILALLLACTPTQSGFIVSTANAVTPNYEDIEATLAADYATEQAAPPESTPTQPPLPDDIFCNERVFAKAGPNQAWFLIDEVTELTLPPLPDDFPETATIVVYGFTQIGESVTITGVEAGYACSDTDGNSQNDTWLQVYPLNPQALETPQP